MKSYKIIKEVLDNSLEGIKGIQVYFAPKYLSDNDPLLNAFKDKCLCWISISDQENRPQDVICKLGIEITKQVWCKEFKKSNKEKIHELNALCGRVKVDQLLAIIDCYIIETVEYYSKHLVN